MQLGQKESKPTEARKIERERERNQCPQFVAWLPGKNTKHGVCKKYPQEILAQIRVILYLKLEDNFKMTFAEANCKQGKRRDRGFGFWWKKKKITRNVRKLCLVVASSKIGVDEVDTDGCVLDLHIPGLGTPNLHILVLQFLLHQFNSQFM